MPETRSFVYLGGFFRGWLPPLLRCSCSSSPLYLRIFEARLHAADVPDTVGRQEVYKARFFWQRRRPGPSRGVSNLTNRLRVEVFRGGQSPAPPPAAAMVLGSPIRVRVVSAEADFVPRFPRKTSTQIGFAGERLHGMEFPGKTAGGSSGNRFCVEVSARNFGTD